MDALVPAFLIALLAEQGDRTQLLAVALGRRLGRVGAVIAGIALAAALNMVLAGVAGLALAPIVPHRAIRLLIGVALILAGAGGAFRVKRPPTVETWRLGALASSAGAFFILGFGDKTQFVTAALAAGSGSPWLAAAGATAGIVAGDAAAVALGERWPALVPLRAVRAVAGALLGIAGLVIALQALEIA